MAYHRIPVDLMSDGSDSENDKEGVNDEVCKGARRKSIPYKQCSMEDKGAEKEPLLVPHKRDRVGKKKSKSKASSDDCLLPPEPEGQCSEQLQNKVNVLSKLVSKGYDINNAIQSNRNFRNPGLYEQFIKKLNINEYGTNLTQNVYDPLLFGKESFYDELKKAQDKEMKRLSELRKKKTVKKNRSQDLDKSEKDESELGLPPPGKQFIFKRIFGKKDKK